MKNNIKTLVLVLTFSICSMTTFASNTSGDEDLATMSDPAALPGDPGAPINDYLIPMLVIGIAIGYRLLRKKTEIVE
jgi:hypothetical protein